MPSIGSKFRVSRVRCTAAMGLTLRAVALRVCRKAGGSGCSFYDCMRIRGSVARCFASLCVTLLAAGCATSGQRGRYLERVEPDSVTNLTAYRAENTLEIRYPLRGKDAFAHATWPSGQAAGPSYQYRFAVLTFGKQKRTARKSVVRRNNQVVIRGAKQWQQLLHAIFAGLVPKQPQHGVLFLVQNMEIVVFRDARGAMKVVNLEKKPAGITVDHTFNEVDFSREAIKLLEASVSALDRNQNQFLFVTGEDPAFVLVDLRERLIVFLSYPHDPEAEPVEVPGWFTVRALNSLLIKSFVVSAIKNPFTLVSRGLWHIGNSGMTVLDSVSVDPSGPPPPLYTGPGMDLAAWEKELDRLVSAKRDQGRVQFFINGNKFFPALIQSIEDDRHSVDVMVYIFDTDDYAIKIADLLKERSASVRVRILMDDLGSLFAGGFPPHSAGPPDFQRPDDIKAYLEAGSHIHVRSSSNPWLTTDHRKCIIIDDREAYLGGMNIGRQYRYEWHDMMVGLTGPIVGRLEK
ncbi:MAG TPA: phospholipase D-like domain-containing protein, partial [Verrucomicrobiae bacterium]|nr:phospholipase D-like domain-containing protein [Verrucomicrobiae bacterium]